MKLPPENPDPRLNQWLESLRPVPPRDPQRAVRARAEFLAAARAVAPVSSAPQSRLNHWKNTIRGFFRPQQEKKPMFSTFGTILLIVSLLLGGGGVTVAAAQSANPDGMLYPVKVWSEDVRYSMTGDAGARLELELQFADRRMAEIQAQVMAGQTPPEAVQARLQTHLELALQTAAGLPPEEIPAALQRIQTALQAQLRTAESWPSADPAGQQVTLRVRTMLQERLMLCEEGLQDPARLRERQQGTAAPNSTQQQGGNATAGAGGSQNPWTEGTPTPGSGYGPGGSQNPWTDQTPTPGSGYGPGESQNPWTDQTPTPGSGYGPGESQNPWTDQTPTPGSGYGPGPGDCTPGACQTCTPNSGSGSQPTDAGGSGGNKP